MILYWYEQRLSTGCENKCKIIQYYYQLLLYYTHNNNNNTFGCQMLGFQSSFCSVFRQGIHEFNLSTVDFLFLNNINLLFPSNFSLYTLFNQH